MLTFSGLSAADKADDDSCTCSSNARGDELAILGLPPTLEGRLGASVVVAVGLEGSVDLGEWPEVKDDARLECIRRVGIRGGALTLSWRFCGSTVVGLGQMPRQTFPRQ